MEKSQYFTKNNIGSKTEELLKSIGQKVQLHNHELDIDKAALLILDMQRFFFDVNSHAFMPSGEAIVEGIVDIAKLFHAQKRPIIATRHINTYENAKMMDFWWRDILTDESEYSNLIIEIKSIHKTELINKSQYDAFYNTNLNELLQELGIEQVITTGVITHLCCETTARSAFVNGYNVFFPIDGTATYNQEIHLASLHSLAHGFVNITTLKRLKDSIIG